jgi:F0F1-type ATP synthase assembly protein I
MPECDICGEEFDTERGLHIHQSQKHDEETETEDVETEEAEEVEESTESSEDTEESAEEAESADEVVEEIERETAGGLLGGFSRESIFVGGALVGIALGLIVGLFLTQGGTGFDQSSPAEVQSQIESVPGLGITVDSVSKEHGLFLVNASAERTVGNQTVSQSISMHVSPDGELLFLPNSAVTFEELNQAAQQETPTTNSTDANATAP